jgi:hypothetical protein
MMENNIIDLGMHLGKKEERKILRKLNIMIQLKQIIV